MEKASFEVLTWMYLLSRTAKHTPLANFVDDFIRIYGAQPK